MGSGNDIKAGGNKILEETIFSSTLMFSRKIYLNINNNIAN